MTKTFSSSLHYILTYGLFGSFFLLTGCQSFLTPTQESAGPAVRSLPIPVASHEYNFDSAREDVIGKLQIITAHEDDTLSDIARRFNLGYEEIVSANSQIDPWLPGVGTKIVIPTQFVLPDAPRQGIVINLAAMRLFYFPPTQAGKPQRVITHPVGIGRVEWKTPEGMTRITAKSENPSWIPTPSIRKEYAKNGNPLPAIVPPGPDNPMGAHVLRLAWPSYAIHGTDKPPSVGLRGSHGCLRMYPEDIAFIYNDVPVGTPVRVVNQPHLFGWRDNALYLQSYAVLEDDKRNHGILLKNSLDAARASSKAQLDSRPLAQINQTLLGEILQNSRAIAAPVTQPGLTLQTYLELAKRVQNTLPFNATWDGNMDGQLTAAAIMEMTGNDGIRTR